MRLRDHLRQLGRRAYEDEGGQMAFLYVLGVLTGLMFFALSTDAGLWYFDQRTAVSQVDAGVQASIQELPAEQDDLDDVSAVLIDWLEHNGTDAGDLSPCPESGAPPGVPELVGDIEYYDQDDDDLYDTVRACVRRQSNSMFANLFNLSGVWVSASSTGRVFRTSTPVDVVLVLDSTGSMGLAVYCNSTDSNLGCPIFEAKQAAQKFIDVLNPTAGGDIQIGLAPFSGCYNPPGSHSSCVLANAVTDLTTSQGVLSARIAAITAAGSTNVCLGMRKGGTEILLGPNQQVDPSTRRIVVLLSDGDNNYNGGVIYQPPDSPDPACRPNTDPAGSDSYVLCSSTKTRERELDVKTYSVATALKTQGAEIYVVGFGVCDNDANEQCDTSIIGSSSVGDNRADQNLLMCMATDSAHYFFAPQPEDIEDIFGQIAEDILERALVQ